MTVAQKWLQVDSLILVLM